MFLWTNEKPAYKLSQAKKKSWLYSYSGMLLMLPDNGKEYVV